MEDYNIYHSEFINNSTFLITGGAGFIGSNIVEYLIKHDALFVRVLDNLSNSSIKNINKFIGLKNFEFIQGDITNQNTCMKAVEGINYVSHQAALGSVPRSIADPLNSNNSNVTGFLNMLEVSRKSKDLKRFVYAASSSTYGDSKNLPKIEGEEGKPLSPYAVTKLINELYAEIYSNIYNFNTIGLRYFNIFGPNQDPKNPYAAVIPIFCKHFINGTKPTINGDGKTSRDFTYVSNAVQANIKALLYNNLDKHEVFNVACGDQTSLNEMIEILKEISGKDINANYTSERVGDVKHSKADISKITNKLNYIPKVNFYEGLQNTFKWYLKNLE